jgi:hypothetical protein
MVNVACGGRTTSDAANDFARFATIGNVMGKRPPDARGGHFGCGFTRPIAD